MPLTDFGRAVRLLRIASGGIYLYSMAEGMGMTPAQLSGIECGRRPLTDAIRRDALKYLRSQGITLEQIAEFDVFRGLHRCTWCHREHFGMSIQDCPDEGDTSLNVELPSEAK
jgi:hypothetical protein